jgi:sterol desaturase/sphingolipid hydroxylase (fatty acid hydroxylase superfamily)
MDKAHLKDPHFWLHAFGSHPWDATKQLFALLLKQGYFDITTFWRQFYDSSVPQDHLRWYNILFYVGCCLAFLIATRPVRELGPRSFFSFLVPPEVRKSKSIFIDLQWFAANLLRLPHLVINILATLLFLHAFPLFISGLHIHVFSGALAGLPDSLRVLMVLVVALVSYDFGYYWAHRILHMPLFWQFHKVHHYSEQLNILVGTRFHPVDSLLTGTLGTAAMAIGVSLFANYAGYENVSELYGVASGYWWFWVLLAVPTVGGPLVHSNVPISYGLGEYVFVSPAMHIVHHARDPELHDLNFGQVISLWDWLFGTMYRHDYSIPFQLGVTEFGDAHYRNIWHSFVEPFGDAYRVLKASLLRRTRPAAPAVSDPVTD